MSNKRLRIVPGTKLLKNCKLLYYLDQWFPKGPILPPRGHLETTGKGLPASSG